MTHTLKNNWLNILILLALLWVGFNLAVLSKHTEKIAYRGITVDTCSTGVLPDLIPQKPSFCE